MQKESCIKYVWGEGDLLGVLFPLILVCIVKNNHINMYLKLIKDDKYVHDSFYNKNKYLLFPPRVPSLDFDLSENSERYCTMNGTW